MTGQREHGTYAAYVWGVERGGPPCRCEDCRAARRDYEKRRRRSPAPPFVSAAAARSHVERLRAAGVGLKRIAKVSGVSHGTLSKLMYGDGRGRAPSKRIRRDTERKILDVSADQMADGAKVPAGPTWALLDEMIAAGVPRSRIAEALGMSSPGLQLSRSAVSGRNARRVADLHSEWAAGRIRFVRRDSHGGEREVAAIAPPPDEPEPPGRADVDYLYLELAEIVEERRAQTWRSRRACRTAPTWMFYPGRGDNETLEAAQAVCSTCPVAGECLAANLTKRDGVFGGVGAGGRRKLAAAVDREPSGELSSVAGNDHERGAA